MADLIFGGLLLLMAAFLVIGAFIDSGIMDHPSWGFGLIFFGLFGWMIFQQGMSAMN